jgi:hypothetical protein
LRVPGRHPIFQRRNAALRAAPEETMNYFKTAILLTA